MKTSQLSKGLGLVKSWVALNMLNKQWQLKWLPLTNQAIPEP